MVRPRIVETDQGITGEFHTTMYDQMMRRMRDKGWLETGEILGAGISSGLALEVGPGPGYLGLEWLKRSEGTRLKGLDISEDMIRLAERNAREYGMMERVEYVKGDARKMPFDDDYFDAVFSNGSLHEWAHPGDILNEIARVLKPEGRYCISDLRRDMSFVIKWFMWLMTRPKEIRPALITSVNASYTEEEVKGLLQGTELEGWQVKENPFGLVIWGRIPIQTDA